MTDTPEGIPERDLGEVFSREIQTYYDNLACRDSARRCQIGMSVTAVSSFALCKYMGTTEIGWINEVVEVTSGTTFVMSSLAVGGSTLGQYLFRRNQPEAPPDVVQT